MAAQTAETPLATQPNARRNGAGAIGANGPLAAELLITTHRAFENGPVDDRALALLHGDLFDSRNEVALSAAQAVGALGHASSYPHLARLIVGAHADDVRIGAVRALAALGRPESVRFFLELGKTVRSEALEREVLTALASLTPADPGLKTMLQRAMNAQNRTSGFRAHAVSLFIKTGGETSLQELLGDDRGEVLSHVIAAVAGVPEHRDRILASAASRFGQMATRDRVSLVTISAGSTSGQAQALLKAALSDQSVEVRRAAYGALGADSAHIGSVSAVVTLLSGAAESNPAIEDEALLAVTRMAKHTVAADAVLPAVRVSMMSTIRDLYKQLRDNGRQLASDSHELGWLIMRSKEYLEYYGTEELKASLLRWLKGTSTDTQEGLIRQLKETATRVEVRHFDGFSSMAELIKNPKRSGMGLIAREIAIAKTGKSAVLWRLIRIIRLSALFLRPQSESHDVETIAGIYAWAKNEKLFRLAEAALWTLAKASPEAALDACRENLALPIVSKVLAIASLHLLHDTDPALLEATTTRLLTSQDDPYVTLNALEAFDAGKSVSNGELARAAITRFSLTGSAEVRDALVDFLGERVSVDITESIKPLTATGDPARRASAWAILDKRVSAGMTANRDGAVEFLYGVLRGEDEASKRSAAAILWKLDDDYASEVLRDLLNTSDDDGAAELLRRLAGSLREPLVSALAPLFGRSGLGLHSVIRDGLRRIEDEELRRHVVAIAIEARSDADSDLDDDDGSPAGEPEVQLQTQRSAFQFERENMEDLVMFFSDIQGYSKKAQSLAPMELATLLQEYEKILFTHVEAHRGELVKRMGDGHMFVFRDPLHAVLAAIRLQKSLKRFNRYRDENHRAVVRIGIHSGKVVRKAHGDVLGNAVNIASRLETSAPPGSALISDRVHEKIKEAVHAREIGQITVKNIAEPIQVYEPYEIMLDLPASLDPLKQEAAPLNAAPDDAGVNDREETELSAGTRALNGNAAGRDTQRELPPAAEGVPPDGTGGPSAVSLDQETYAEIIRCFSTLIEVCRKADSGSVPVMQIAESVLVRWKRLRPRLPLPRGAHPQGRG